MSGPTLVWGAVADEFGLYRQRHVEGETTADGRFVATALEVWGAEPADAYATTHPAPMPMRWRHGDDIGRVIALRSMGGKLFAVAECELSPGELAALTDEFGALRWSSGTSQVGRGSLELRECSLTPTPASVGLSAVSWYRHGVSRGQPPSWVDADVERGRADMSRRRTALEVYEKQGHWLTTEREAAAAHIRGSGDRHNRQNRHNPREMFYGAGGRIIAVKREARERRGY